MQKVFPLDSLMLFNSLRLRQDGRHIPDDILKCIFLNENVWILINISLKFVLKGPVDNIPALIQIMAWRRPGDKPLSEPMMVSLLTHICVTRPQWVNSLPTGRCGNILYSEISDRRLRIKFMSTSYDIALRWMPQNIFHDKSTLVQVMAWCCQAAIMITWANVRSMSSYGLTRPQWVHTQRPEQNGSYFADDIFKYIFMTKKFCISI